QSAQSEANQFRGSLFTIEKEGCDLIPEYNDHNQSVRFRVTVKPVSVSTTHDEKRDEKRPLKRWNTYSATKVPKNNPTNTIHTPSRHSEASLQIGEPIVSE